MVIMKISDILKTGMAKIEDEKNWIQGVSARDRNGIRVSPEDKEAVCWCASGSIYSQASYLSPEYFLLDGVTNLLDATTGIDCGQIGLRPIARFNDTHTHAEVIALFKLVIAEQEAKELKESEALLA
jgi:hypothetical protein